MTTTAQAAALKSLGFLKRAVPTASQKGIIVESLPKMKMPLPLAPSFLGDAWKADASITMVVYPVLSLG
ncbi:MAG: hypothetical protein M3O33_08210 [Cyanobacteriota bacterium]|nr:hypothetical protein [Cyanobacteriota bacterium]